MLIAIELVGLIAVLGGLGILMANPTWPLAYFYIAGGSAALGAVTLLGLALMVLIQRN